MRRTGLIVYIGSVLLALLLIGCKACSGNEPLATLESKQGQVDRSEAKQNRQWTSAAIGAAFVVGDALRTSRASTAMLALFGGGKLTVKQSTTIRFQNRRPSTKSQDIDVETGQVLLEAGDRELLLATDVGLARIEPNGKVLIQRTAAGVQFDVTVGKARFETPDGSNTVEQGQSYVVSVGPAAIEKDEPTDAGHRTVNRPELVDASMPADAVDAAGAAAPGTTHGVTARVMGNGVSQRGPTDRSFQKIAPGTTLVQTGTTLHIEAGSSVELERGQAKVALSGSGSYQVKADSDALVEMQTGRLQISGPTRIVVPGGVIQTTDNAAAALESLGKNRTRVRVTQGSASLSNAQGTTKISAGEEATLHADSATRAEGRSLGFADISINAGESVTIHDPAPPTAVRFQFGSHCPSGGTIRELAKKSSNFASGETNTVLALGAGRHDYGLYCLTDRGPSTTVAARGTLTILRDAGTRPVPTTPPSTSVNTDGRNYTVMYQNQLPNVTVNWPNAAAGSSYRVYVESRNGTRTYPTSTPSYTFRSGTLPEGHHEIYFEGGGRISRHTGVEVVFDNAAPMASLMTPVQPEVSASGDITIAGVAQPGWQVEIGGDKIAQDAQQRFSQRLQVPASDRAVAVKLSHATRGTHVYLRRTARDHD